MSGLAAVERAVLDALRADVGVRAVLGVAPRVFAGDAEKPAYPYLEVSRHAVEDVSGADALMWRHELDLAVMTSVGGRDEARRLRTRCVRWSMRARCRLWDTGACLHRAPFIDVMRASVHLWRALVRVRLQVEPAP